MDAVTIIVATFGDDCWRQLAAERAVPSAEQFGWPVVSVHGDTLHGARNEGLAAVDTEFVVHLDADDELERYYPCLLQYAQSTGCDIVAPAVRYVRPGWANVAPRMPSVASHDHMHACWGDCLPDGNWLVIGALARTEIVRAVGGWRDWPCYEDWDLWLRCWRAGALIGMQPQAVYRAHTREHSRNRYLDKVDRNAVHRAIAADVMGAEYGKQ